MIVVKHRGNFNNTKSFLNRARRKDFLRRLDLYGQEGVAALSAATPVDTGKTAASWGYEIKMEPDGNFVISWTNDNINNGVPIALVIQYGHATRDGGWVEGRDYINPAIKPVVDRIAEDIWKEIKR